jgi:hypothetical protein
VRTFAKSTRRSAIAVLIVSLAAIIPPSSALADNAQGDTHFVLRADLVGSLNTDPILFGAVPGTQNMSVSRSTVTLTSDGHLTARIRGLIIVAEGKNLLPLLSASLVCNGQVVDRVSPVPFSEAGDARINATVQAPSRCLAPAVLINPLDRNNVYIAVSGSVG